MRSNIYLHPFALLCPPDNQTSIYLTSPLLCRPSAIHHSPFTSQFSPRPFTSFTTHRSFCSLPAKCNKNCFPIDDDDDEEQAKQMLLEMSYKNGKLYFTVNFSYTQTSLNPRFILHLLLLIPHSSPVLSLPHPLYGRYTCTSTPFRGLSQIIRC